MNNVIYLSHGGGPYPLLREDLHENMISYYKEYGEKVKPEAIVVFSAHYEGDDFEVVYDFGDELYFDYYGFPEETYKYKYNPPKNETLGKEIINRINDYGLKAVSKKRGLDHGVFIPLMIMYENADIPVVQVSLKKGLDEEAHVKLGEALRGMDNILFIGSGFSYHNIRDFMRNSEVDQMNDEFHEALIKVVQSDMEESERKNRYINWEQLPHARKAHPRSEHFIPLLVCYGIAGTKGTVSFDDKITGKRCICVEW